MEALLGSKFVGKNGAVVSAADAFAGKTAVGIYFSAHCALRGGAGGPVLRGIVRDSTRTVDSTRLRAPLLAHARARGRARRPAGRLGLTFRKGAPPAASSRRC